MHEAVAGAGGGEVAGLVGGVGLPDSVTITPSTMWTRVAWRRTGLPRAAPRASSTDGAPGPGPTATPTSAGPGRPRWRCGGRARPGARSTRGRRSRRRRSRRRWPRPAATATKNQVAKRLGASGGGTQKANGTRSSTARTTPVSSAASRTAAWRAASSSSMAAPAGASSSSTLPPGNTHMPAEGLAPGLAQHEGLEPGVWPGAARTTVAAGMSGASPVPSKRTLRWPGTPLTCTWRCRRRPGSGPR